MAGSFFRLCVEHIPCCLFPPEQAESLACHSLGGSTQRDGDDPVGQVWRFKPGSVATLCGAGRELRLGCKDRVA